jgi:hypothetical protein
MRGARGLYYLHIVELIWSVISTFSFLLMPRFGTDIFVKWMRASWAVWVLFGVANFIAVIPFAKGQKGTRAEGVSWLVLIILGVGLFLEILGLMPAGLEGRAFEVANYLLSTAGVACFFVMLLRASPQPIPTAPLYWVLFAITATLSLLQTGLSFETYRQFLLGPIGMGLRWVRFGCSIGQQIIVLMILKQLMQGGEAPAAVKPPSNVSAAREIIIGSVFLLGGLAVTLISYSAASGGGRYVIASGAIAFGLVRLIRGLVRISGG